MRFDNLASAYLAGSTWLSDSGIQSNLEGPINPAVSDNEFLWDQVRQDISIGTIEAYTKYRSQHIQNSSITTVSEATNVHDWKSLWTGTPPNMKTIAL